jgi:hypothetical protein
MSEERNWIIWDNWVGTFCLLHGKEEICYAKGTERKPLCLKPRCKGEHVQWLHEVLSSRDVSVDNTETEELACFMAEEEYNLWIERQKEKSHPQRDA